MKTIVFVHGTGVRKESYDASMKLVAGALSSTEIAIEPCFWGGECGATLFLGGASVPGFDRTRAIGSEPASENVYDVALWAMLYDDPVAELQLLALRDAGQQDFRPGGPSAGEEIVQRLTDFDAVSPALPGNQADALRELIAAAAIDRHIGVAQTRLLETPFLGGALGQAREPLGEYRQTLARALVATALAIAWGEGALPHGTVLLDGPARDRLVALIAAALGDAERSLASWVQEFAGRLVMGAGTRWFERQRGSLSQKIAPFGADVIAYQARPKPIRGYIRRTLNEVSAAAQARGRSGALVLLAHSLGGIACVDALIEAAHPAVMALITVGSQAPLLYELDALTSLSLPHDDNGRPTGKPGALPEHFPRWLNIYDPRDFLSYRAEPVFGASCVRDLVVDNRQPFPAAHSAYWSNAAVWKAVRSLLDEVSQL